jgi:hypothetical protein
MLINPRKIEHKFEERGPISGDIWANQPIYRARRLRESVVAGRLVPQGVAECALAVRIEESVPPQQPSELNHR